VRLCARGAALLAVGLALGAPSVAQATQSAWVLSTNAIGSDYNPTYLGNGYMGTRVPAEGEGFQASPVRTETHIAGVWEQTLNTVGLAAPPGAVTATPVAAPQWTGLDYDDGPDTWSTGSGQLLHYRQTLDLHRGVLTTAVRWRSPSGHVTDFNYQVVVDRARIHVGVVRLSITPHWSGEASVEDVLGPGGGIGAYGFASFSALVAVSSGADAATATNRYVARTPSGFATIAETSHLSWSPSVHASAVQPTSASERSGLKVTFPVRAGRSYQLTKIVGIATTADSPDPAQLADAQSATAAKLGPDRLLGESAAAWAQLWRSRVDVIGDPELTRRVHASQFYLLSSFNKDVSWSTSPGGLSSSGYQSHIFWDAETWMYPSVMIVLPVIAAAIDSYREKLLAGAKAYAAAGGYAGARFPWESAASGGEESPPPYATLEQHISSDVALAQWQYFLATGDKAWLAHDGYPVLAGVADFWASRAVPMSGGYQILGVMPPDEYNFPVNNSAYTNVAAATALRLAAAAARALGRPAPPQWTQVANGLIVPFDSGLGIHPEYDGYDGREIKQADTVMLTYPWEYPMPARVAAADLDYYVPRTDPNGPSMTDSIHAIDTMALSRPGCAAYTFMRRSLDPFVRPPFEQMSETRSGGAFTFLTGTGGFLQTFLYGFTGFRWRPDRILLDPSLPPQLHGVVDRALQWHGRTFTVDIRRRRTSVTLLSGGTVAAQIGGRMRWLRPGHPLRVRTRHDDGQATGDLARCRPITDSAGGAFPFAANDGSLATAWFGASATEALVVDLGAHKRISRVAISWASTPPANPGGGLVGAPPTTSGTLARATDYRIDVSGNRRTWHTVLRVKNGSGPVDNLHFLAVAARYLRLAPITVSNGVPGVEELGVSR
jgi:trehalose/maltose hydrolase-like predicted phosphorylase